MQDSLCTANTIIILTWLSCESENNYTIVIWSYEANRAQYTIPPKFVQCFALVWFPDPSTAIFSLVWDQTSFPLPTFSSTPPPPPQKKKKQNKTKQKKCHWLVLKCDKAQEQVAYSTIRELASPSKSNNTAIDWLVWKFDNAGRFAEPLHHTRV